MTAKQISVTLVRSRIGSTPHQRKLLDALGLRKMHKTKVFNDTPAIRGIIAKVPHMLKVEEVMAEK